MFRWTDGKLRSASDVNPKTNNMKNTLLIIALFLSVQLAARDYECTFAVVVGISNYQNFEPGQGDLNYPLRDAELFGDFLIGAGGGQVPRHHIYYLLNEYATRENILGALREMGARATERDRLIFFFSGHGVKHHLMPYEGTYREDLIPFSEIKEVFHQSKALTKMLFLDACHSNSIKPPKRERPVRTTTTTVGVADKQVVIMSSSQSYQPSAEYGNLQQGVFSYFLIDGLRGAADADGDRRVSIRELHNHVHSKVTDYSDGFQRPHTWGSFSDQLVVAYLE